MPKRRLQATQLGLGPAAAPAGPKPPAPRPFAVPKPPAPQPPAPEPHGLEEATVVAEDLRSELASALTRSEHGEERPPKKRFPSLPDDFDDQPTSMMDRAMLEGLSGDAFAGGQAEARSAAKAPIPARPAPAPAPPARPAPARPAPAPPRPSAPRAARAIPATVPPPRASSDDPVTRVAIPARPKPQASSHEAPRPRVVDASPGATEDVDGILRMLEAERIFEPPTSAPSTWTKKVERTGTRVGRTFIALWVLGVLAAVGGYMGWSHWIDLQKAEARQLREDATTLALRGDNADIVQGIEQLQRARKLHPTARDGYALEVALLAEQLLEGGGADLSRLRDAAAAAERQDVDAGLVRAARAVVAFVEARPDRVLELLGEDAEASEDPWVLYIRGRLLSRLGGEGAEDILVAALAAEPRLVAAELALAEIDAAKGRSAEAKERLDRVLERDTDHLRAKLLAAFLAVDVTEPDAVLSAVAGLEPRHADAAPTDRALARILEAHAARRKGERQQAVASIERAAREPLTSPALLVLVAREAQAVGELGQAQRAAAAAVAAAPQDVRARSLLAEIALDRGDAQSALRTLGALSTDDPDVLRLSARAALALGGASLEAADGAMDAYLEAHEDAPTALRALALRMKARRGGGSASLLGQAERLTRAAPGDPDALIALVEVALEAREPAKAQGALERLVSVEPDDAFTHFLLGRARRMAGEAQPAREAFRHALELEPTFGEAKVALGYLLLDMGVYEEAEALYQEMARGTRLASGGSVALLARLGRVEALLGLGRVADAKVQLEGMSERDSERPEVRVTVAHVALADGRPADALQQTRALAEAEGASADAIALYGDALYAANETEAASGAYERALGVDSGSPEALLGYAEVLIRGEKYDDAKTILERARESLERRIRPEALRARRLALLGKAALAAGEVDEARTSLRQATGMAGVPAEAWFHLGEALAGANTPDARAAYTRYLELAPSGPYAERARRAIR
jgi:tetratricopeptide (TPR) repeat protein